MGRRQNPSSEFEGFTHALDTHTGELDPKQAKPLSSCYQEARGSVRTRQYF